LNLKHPLFYKSNKQFHSLILLDILILVYKCPKKYVQFACNEAL
jgi:hypothetical protein